MARPSGKIVETPIKSSFREGLSVLEYFSSTHGARKGLADTALKTANSGYLTRKLADVAQNVVVTMHDCGTTRGVAKKPLYRGDTLERGLGEAVLGRVSLQAVHGRDGKVLVREKELITAALAGEINKLGLDQVQVRSPMACDADHGVCRLCYGMDLATGTLVEEGMAVGIIAAQSIGEPATQLTLRTFHFGGAARVGEKGGRHHGRTHDITVGLPRVIELFEAQRPEHPSVLAEVAGRVRVGSEGERRRRKRVVFVQPLDEQGRPAGPELAHLVPPGRLLEVETGDRVEAGDALTDGTPLPQDLLAVCGLEAVQDYLLTEAQAVYRGQHVEIDDKHLEVIIARMVRRVKVKAVGDTALFPGSVLDRTEFRAVNEALRKAVKVVDPGDSAFTAGQLVPKEVLRSEKVRLLAAGLRQPTFERPRPATCTPVLLGVTRAALQGQGFLAAASFQETTRVLAEAALAGKVDGLAGLKENVLLGHLVPAGTGYQARHEPRPVEAPAGTGQAC
jgi:DNA-directed RNA polymerase subunit beta'